MNQFWIAVAVDDKGQLVIEKNTIANCPSLQRACEAAKTIQAETGYQVVVLGTVRMTGEAEAPPIAYITRDDLGG